MNSTPPGSPKPATASALDLLFAGLHFRLLGDGAQLSGFTQARHVFAPLPTGLTPLATVLCELQAAPCTPPARMSGHPIEWTWQGTRGRVRTHHFEATLEQRGPRQFALQARLTPDRDAPGQLLCTVAPPLLTALGGTVLHAASVELNGYALAFVGPSGAGKSTACRHVAGARWFSLDRLAIAPGVAPAAGYLAFPLPGGKAWEGSAAGSLCPALPLAAILRVVQGGPGPRLTSTAAHRRLSLLRQAAVHGDRSVTSQQALLGALDALGRTVTVGTLEFALGNELRPELERFLIRGSTS